MSFVNASRGPNYRPGSVKITTAEFAAKFNSKTEVYRFLASEVKAYLPSIDCVTIYFLKDIASGDRKFIKSDFVKHLSVPHFEGLTVEAFLEYSQKYQQIERYTK